MVQQIIPAMNYWLAKHPTVMHFRWSPTQSWGSTWFFLIASISAYITISTTLQLLFLLLCCHKPVPLGLIPAFHNLAMALISTTIFFRTFFSSVVEICDTRWFWQRSKTPFQWLLCFPWQ
ncbi:Elongation of fatty acids protein 3-like [Forsythia ovata]|uniref:Elongation of fatty acids protein 3-like n=1 Tax=Forsythia ovata TaxID=205694 RepID=A0ABD1W6B0_9LAMI